MTSRGQLLIERLGPLPQDMDVRADEPMARHTTLRLGGPADLWLRPGSVESLSAVLRAAHPSRIPVHFVGAGTNLLVRDGGLRGIVLNLGRINRVWRPDPETMPEVVEVEAGASTGRLLKHAMQWELGGVEFLGGVPGSVGGGLIMNAGTYLGEFTDVVSEVRCVRIDGAPTRRPHAQCGFRYRDSAIPKDEIVVGARLRLEPRAREEIERDVSGLRQRRHEREPKGVPNNGSTFKNPPGDYAGRLIETAELKGVRRGGAIVSPTHANWLVVDREHDAPCTASDMLSLIEHVQHVVERIHGVRLETEVKVVGEESR